MWRHASKIIVAVGLGVLILSSEAVYLPKSFTSFYLGKVLASPLEALRTLIGLSSREEEFIALRLENEKLKTELFRLHQEPRRVEHGMRTYYTAKVYSNYPFNNRGLVVVNAGSEHGIRTLLPVTVGENVLFGQVIHLLPHQSVVRTVFDADWKLPVKIGEKGIDGLFLGGREPRVELIVAGKGVKEGQTVFLASQDFPYGLEVGKIASVEVSSDRAFEQARIKLPFSPSEVEEVMVLITP